jgi:TRAP-type C4-dicarboxylate transport system permease small subunit
VPARGHFFRFKANMEKDKNVKGMNFRKSFDFIERLTSLYIPGIILVYMGIIVTAEILARVCLNYSFWGIVDTVDQSILMLGYLSLAWVQRGRDHITVDLLPAKLRHRRAGSILDCMILAFCLVVAGFLFYEICWYLVQAYSANEQTMTLFWPKWPFVIFMALGVMVFLIRLGLQFWDSLDHAVNYQGQHKNLLEK